MPRSAIVGVVSVAVAVMAPVSYEGWEGRPQAPLPWSAFYLQYFLYAPAQTSARLRYPSLIGLSQFALVTAIGCASAEGTRRLPSLPFELTPIGLPPLISEIARLAAAAASTGTGL